MASAAIYAISTVSGNQPRMVQISEDAGQTFLFGTPVQINSGNGAITAWDGTTIPAIVGIVRTNGQNLASAGVSNPLHYGSVPNQSSAVNIPVGQPLAYPRCIVETANEDSVFFGQVGPAQTTAATDVGKSYGMTKDTDNHWFVDKTKTGASSVVRVVALDQFDTTRGVWFVFIPADVILIA